MTGTTVRWRKTAIARGFEFFRATGLHRLAAPLTRGCGAILMFHHVRPWAGDGFAPNRGLEITPDYFETVILTLRDRGFEIVSLDAAIERLRKPKAEPGPPFAVLTFDDGYRDVLEFALPILRRHAAPFSMFVAAGFAERTARVWWEELEAAVRGLSEISVTIGGERLVYPAANDAEKEAAWTALYWRVRHEPEPALLDIIGRLAATAGVDSRTIVEHECMDWNDLAIFAAEPLCTIGSHTVSHPRLATCAPERVRQELAESLEMLAARLGVAVRHLAYPVGDVTSAGPREFALATEAGYASAVTTRPGMLYREHRAHLMALPRVSVNGEWQSRAALDVLLSGAPFLLWNRGRRVTA